MHSEEDKRVQDEINEIDTMPLNELIEKHATIFQKAPSVIRMTAEKANSFSENKLRTEN